MFCGRSVANIAKFYPYRGTNQTVSIRFYSKNGRDPRWALKDPCPRSLIAA